jgi:hypothetical protein
METGTVVALGIVAVVIGAAIYLATRTPPAAAPMLAGAGFGGPQAEGAQYITAGGTAIGAILNGVGGLYSNIGRQAGGSSAGAGK